MDSPMKRSAKALLTVLLPLAAACCSSGPSPLPSLTTGSLFGNKAAVPPPGPTSPANTPVNRAFQVGTVSARATKCGFNFDTERLKANYLAAEGQMGTSVDDLAKAEKVMRVGYNGVLKAANRKDDYCTEKRTAEIKADLARLLSGDYTPQAARPREEEDPGIFSFGNGYGLANNPLE
jgi:hypothetical protein